MKDQSPKKPIDFSGLRPASSYLDDVRNLLHAMDQAQADTEAFLRKSQETLAAGVPNGQKQDLDQPSQKTATQPQAQQQTQPQEDLQTLLAQLDSLVGLERVKENVRSLINLVKVRKLREQNGLPTPPLSLHLVFMGNPGTGKTTVARLIAKLYRAVGVLSKGQLVEVDRSGLVAGYVGQTAIQTGQVIQKALGGVLFIDEAYALIAGEGANDFGREAVETLLKAMEDHRDDFVVIVAGYADLMERFISSNPGLESRFNRYFVFEDYDADQLNAIFQSMCEKTGIGRMRRAALLRRRFSSACTSSAGPILATPGTCATCLKTRWPPSRTGWPRWMRPQLNNCRRLRKRIWKRRSSCPADRIWTWKTPAFTKTPGFWIAMEFGNLHTAPCAVQYRRTTAVTFPSKTAFSPSMGAYSAFSGKSHTWPVEVSSRLQVASSSNRAITISPLRAVDCLRTTTVSPSKMPAFFMLSPRIIRAK